MSISKDILDFFDSEKRDLPWRNKPTPYKTFISEIMLQQTRVETVIPYFNRFMEVIPTIEDLAKIDDELLLKLWQGLGYYNRAKNLKKAAIMIIENFGGNIPSSIEELETLPGIGPYTARAIGSIAFQIRTLAIDGNVLRVFSRYYGILGDIRLDSVKQEIKMNLESIYPMKRAGDFTEALMEIGATVCLPNGKPLCEKCPLRIDCFAYKYQKTDVIPFKSKSAKRTNELLTVMIVRYKNKMWIQKRPKTGLLASLWELPHQVGHLDLVDVKCWLHENNIEVSNINRSISSKHIFTHIEWDMISYEIELNEVPTHLNNEFLELEEIKNHYSIPTAFLKFISDRL